jgi:hypothetical protein
VGKKAIFPRPGVEALLEFLKSKFDIVLWAGVKIDEVVQELDPIFTEDQLFMMRRILDDSSLRKLGFMENSNKEILLKDINSILKTYPEYCPENVVLVECQPHRCSLNPFYSSLFAESFNGQSSDNFLVEKLLPYLMNLYVSKKSLHMTIKANYPTWGKKALASDWRRNQDIWSAIERSGIGNKDHFRRFRHNRDL